MDQKSDRQLDAETDLFLRDLIDSGKPPERAAPLKPQTAEQRLAQHIADINRPRTIDPFEVEASLHRMRIAREIQMPTRPGQVFNAGSGSPLSETSKASVLNDGDLMHRLETERPEDDADPELVMLQKLGVAPSTSSEGTLAKATGMVLPQVSGPPPERLAKLGLDDNGDLPEGTKTSTVLDLVAEKCTSAGGRELAEQLASMARSFE